MAMSADYRSKFADLHWWWWRLQMSEEFLNGTRKPKQMNEQKNSSYKYIDKI